MKNKFRYLFISLQGLFYVAIPSVIIWLQYGKGGEVASWFKLSITGTIVALFVYLCIKRLWLKPEVDKWNQKIVNLETTSYSITKKENLSKARSEWRLYSFLTLIVNTVAPMILFVLALIVIRVVEQGLIKLYGVLCFCGGSMALGVIVRMIEICTSKFKGED